MCCLLLQNGIQKRQHKINVIPEKFPEFRFPLENPELNRKWIRFVNRRDWAPTRRFGTVGAAYYDHG